jgi:chemotaxis protein MotB
MADSERPIIIKRIKKSAAAHHGGSWKVAYADFVTAMMAFFLLLWLLNATTKEQREGIADYFRPTIATSASSSSMSVLDGQAQVMKTMSGAASTEATIEEELESPTPAEQPAQTPAKSEQSENPVDVKEAKEALRAEEHKTFEAVKQQIEKVIAETPDLAELKKNLLIEETPEGLRIQLLDKEKVSMFPSGSSELNERSKELIKLVAAAVKDMPNKLSISGHTDAQPYVGSGQRTNWELSSERANAARRVMVESGIDPTNVEAVAGKADTELFVKDNPLDPQNRRISIVLLSEAHRQDVQEITDASTPAKPAAPEAPVGPTDSSGNPAEIIPSTNEVAVPDSL